MTDIDQVKSQFNSVGEAVRRKREEQVGPFSPLPPMEPMTRPPDTRGETDIGVRRPTTKPAADPAPRAVDLCQTEYLAVIDKAAVQALDHGRLVRDAHDAAMRAVAEGRDALRRHGDEYFAAVQSVMDCNGIIEEALAKQKDMLAKLTRTVEAKPEAKPNGSPRR